MASQATILKVFVSSPSDVKGERLAIVKIIEEINNEWSEFLGIRLEPILWEKYCHPAAGKDPQQVISDQLPKDYDIYLGVLWKQFGTPTPRFESGTEEEFQKAYERSRIRPKNVSVMVYFKNEPILPTEIDTIQFDKLNKFKEKLGPKGVLYWEFLGNGEFRQLVRLHLIRELQIKSEDLKIRSTSTSQNRTSRPEVDLEELESKSNAHHRKVMTLVFEAIKSLDHYEAELIKIDATSQEMLSQFVYANESYCDLVESLLPKFVKAIEDAAEVWVDFFIAELLLGKLSQGKSEPFQERISVLAGNFSGQAERYREEVEVEDVLTFIPELFASDQRVKRTNDVFATELDRASKILKEAEQIIIALKARRQK